MKKNNTFSFFSLLTGEEDRSTTDLTDVFLGTSSTVLVNNGASSDFILSVLTTETPCSISGSDNLLEETVSI